MRLFLAINLPEAHHLTLQNGLRPLDPLLQTSQAQIRWVPPTQYHLTIRFMGKFPDGELSRLQQHLRDGLSDIPSFNLTLEGFGLFPARGMPHSLWIGAAQGREALEGLALRADQEIDKLEIPKEPRSFHPHLTVGRIRFIRDGRLLREQLSRCPSPRIGPVRIERVDLMESRLRPQGPEYQCLLSVPLAS